MAKNIQRVNTRQARAPQIGRLTLLAGALIATGILTPLSLPQAVAAPLPVPCGGCFKGTTAIDFVTMGTARIITILDPFTGLPVNGGTNLTVDQTSSVAILNWKSFDIAKGYSVNINNYNSDGVTFNNNGSTLNRIYSADPATIAGSFRSNGNQYLISPNGIIFAKGAQVNTGTLVASSLDITDKLFQDGFLTNLTSGVIPAFSGIGGFVKVETDAVLNGSRIMLFAPVVENNGTINTPDGQTVLAAGHKIYLEASQDPNLRGVLVEVDVNNPGVSDPLLAGYGLQYTEAGVATNAGDIISERGNITLAGFAVNQQGRLSATTSVYENGSIKLLARYGVQGAEGATGSLAYKPSAYNASSKTYDIRATQTGKVTLAKDSVTAITPELADTATTNDGQGYKKSIVEVMGNTIEMQSGSKIIVPGGQVTLAAISSYVPSQAAVVATPTTPEIPAVPASGLIPSATIVSAYQEIAAPAKLTPDLSTSFINPDYIPSSAASDNARVFLDSGSLIDVSGSSANVSVARNILTVQLRGAQLKDAPVQRIDRFLWGKDVLVDIRNGTPLADYAPEEASQIGRTVAERTSAGGNVKLVSTGDVVMKSGAKVDLSGGQVNYEAANIKTTSLISNGVVYDIANAAPDRIYNGISGTITVNHKKWGFSETFTSMAGGDIRGRRDAGYVEGKAAGTLTVLAPHAVIDGDIVARTVAGTYQRDAYVDLSKAGTVDVPYKKTWKMMAKAGTLVIGNSDALADNNGLINYINDSNVTIQNEAPKLANDFALSSTLPAVSQQDIFLDAAMFGSANGLNHLEVYSNRKVNVTKGTSVKLAPGGSISLQGGEVNMLGSIDAPSGTVKLATALTDPAASRPGALTVGAAGTYSYISTHGQWVNDSPLFGVPDWSKPLTINGGSINLSSGGDLLVAAGTLLDASGGAQLDAKGKYTGGNGGSITLKSGKSTVKFRTKLDGIDLRSYGTAGGKGGSLTIAASDITLGGEAKTDTKLALAAAFFQNGGFTNFDLTAQNGDMTVAADTVIEPRAQSLILDRTASLRRSGSDVNTFAKTGVLPEWQRKAASIALNASGGTLKVEEGAVIRVDPTASISLAATNQLTVLGTLDARAGTINLGLDKLEVSYLATQSIWLGSQSKLLSQGYFLQSQPNAQNLTQGQVLSGGKININAETGYVIAQKGSTMDVSGVSADIDLPQLQAGNLYYRRSHVAGDAGAISVQTSAGGFLDGSMNAGVEAGSQAAAGKLSLILNNSFGITNKNTAFPHEKLAQMQVMASGNGSFATHAGLTPGNDTVAGQAELGGLAGNMWLDASALKKSGFDQVMLKSGTTIALADQANIETRRSVTLDAPQLLVNGESKISSALVTVGNLNLDNQELLDPLTQLKLKPVAGNGVLNVTGQMVDLTGNFIVSGINQLNVNSKSDIRLNGVIDNTTYKDGKPTLESLTGSLHTQGNITLEADQVYPSTLAQFTLSVEDEAGAKAGSITVQKPQVQHSPKAVMSAGGKITFKAADIRQNGVVKAPLGTVDLQGSDRVTLGAGSLTSVSANGLTLPFGVIEGGNTWKYYLTGTDNLVTVDTPPQKQVKLSAPNIDNQSGSTVDLSGGGDLYAYEFFAGSGGSKNVLDPSKAPANTYAIIPGLSGYSPYDPQASGQYTQADSKTTLQAGTSVYLAGGNGIKEGYYTLLPASYALLPGAYRVTAVAGYADRQPGLGATTLVDGSQIMAGKFAVVGTNIQDARYSGFMVTPGSVVRTQSEFHDSNANQFFTAQAASNETAIPRLAKDAGQLIISAVGSGATLALDGTFNALPGSGGRGALVDLDGPGFEIVNTIGPASGRVQLTSSTLNKLGAESLLIGGVRTQSATGMDIAVSASEVVVDNAGSVLSGPEIILAANNAVSVKTGSVIEGKGTLSGLASDINIGSASVSGDGALLRVSSAEQVRVTRKNLTGAVATLSVENGATLGASDVSGTNAGAQNAVLLDSSYATSVGNTAVINAKSFSVAAQNIDIGTNSVPAATSLALSGDLLARALTFKNLTLHSYNDINFFGAASLGGLNANQQHVLNNLVLDARSLNGFNNATQTNNIDASNVTLLNSNTGTSAAIAYGAGNLKINTEQITLGAGDKLIQGFDTVTLAATKQIVAQDKGSVTVNAGDTAQHSLVLEAGQITGTNKSDLTITGSNSVISIQPVAGATETASEALNAKLKIVGKSIVNDGVINLAAGSVTLRATGTDATDNVTLGNGSRTAATGFSKTISGQTVYAQAGSVSLISDNGGVEIQSGAVVDVSAAAEGDAGSLNITATKGAVSVAGNLKGAANVNYAQGSFTLDANTLTGISANALTGLNDTLTAGGFTAMRDLRFRTDDWVIEADAPGSVRAQAHVFHLTADNGKIDVYGTIDSSGIKRGDILLAAKNDLTLHAGSLLDAHATGAEQKGGKVALQTTAGTIELNNQRIDVHGSGNTGGSILLRAPQINAYTDVALNNTGGSGLNVSTGAKVTVEAFRNYSYAGSLVLSAANAATTTTVYKNDATAFTNNATAIKSWLGMLADPNLHLTPGVELDSAGDLTLATNLDLSTWRFNDGNGGIIEPGILTFRVAGNLNFGSGTTQASLTDGFTPPPANNEIKSVKDVFATITPTTTDSWSYRLIAGADAGSADVMAVKSTVPATGAPTTGNVVLVAGKEATGKGATAYFGTSIFTMQQIRTGTGFIDIAAGGNLSLGNRDSVIYTAGRATTASGMPTATNRHFGEDGGDISIRVKGDVLGAATDQLITDWQWRQGTADLVTAQPAWWINVGSFRQNVGALGGGNISVVAGGNINDLSAVAPTTGYLDMNTKQAVVLGGGDVSVTAGASINSGVFYVGKGQGTIRAGDDLGSTRKIGASSLYTVLALGEGSFDVRAGGDLNLQPVINPTMLAQGYSQLQPGASTGAKTKNFFSTYGDNSGVSLSSLSGNVLLNDLGKSFTNTKYAYTTNPNQGFFYLNITDNQGAYVYPGSLTATALNGSIVNAGTATMFPSASGNLKLVAANDIHVTGINMSDAAADNFRANAPTSSISTLVSVMRSGHGSIHAQDVTPVILSAGGSISGNLTLPKVAQIQAGQNIQNMNFSVQNLHATDSTSIVAGKDILNVSANIAGPGQVVLQAGRNVDLGQGSGITTTGNLVNRLLPEQGADITVLAGVGQGAEATHSFIGRYIDPNASTTYGENLISYVSNYGAPQNQTADQAFTTFSSLSKPLQDAFVRQAFFSELRSSGRDAVTTKNYQTGLDAIATLFPSTGYKGDVNLYYSQIKTVRGGDINIFTPGGGVNAGLANEPANGIKKEASELGIVTVKGGDINAFVNKDFTVNQSRVFTLQGGNILLWSSNGDIDAGKGSKSVSSTPPPILLVDLETGTFKVDATRSVVGSGIAVLLANKDVIPGTVDLIAPNGTVNAGDAGIRSAGDIFLAAAHVVGGDNISFGGAGAGLPPAAPAPIGVGLNLQDASKAADQATQSLASVSDMNVKDFKPTFLSVEVIGMGEQKENP